VESIREYQISEIDELRLLYYEIIQGSSYQPEIKLFVKHFSERDSFLLLRKRIELFHKYSDDGVPHEKELLANAIANEEWSEEKEHYILTLKYHISDNEKTIHNIIPQQRKGIEKIIENKRIELQNILIDRKGILGKSIEDLIDEDIGDYLSYLSFYKDENCKIPYIDFYEDFQNLEVQDINKLNSFLNKEYRRFSEENIKKVACMPFFLNKFSYSKEDIQSFFGIPVNDLTNNQTLLISLGVRNLNTLSQAEGAPPDINLDGKAFDIAKWYDLQASLMIAKRNQSK